MVTLTVNMRQMGRWCVTSDNVRWYDSIMCSKGKVQTLDAAPYVNWLCEYGIFYTVTH